MTGVGCPDMPLAGDEVCVGFGNEPAAPPLSFRCWPIGLGLVCEFDSGWGDASWLGIEPGCEAEALSPCCCDSVLARIGVGSLDMIGDISSMYWLKIFS